MNDTKRTIIIFGLFFWLLFLFPVYLKAQESNIPGLPQLSSREDVLNTVSIEGWYYDDTEKMLLISYQLD